MQLLPTLVLLLTIDSAMTAGDTKHLFEDHGKATNFKPVITMRGRYTRNKEKKLVAVVLGSLSKLKRMNANFTETAQNTTNSLDKAREEMVRYDYILRRIDILKLLSKQNALSVGSMEDVGIVIKPIRTKDDSVEHRRPGQNMSQSNKTITILSDCSPEKTTPWERQKETYTVYFPLHELYNDFSKKDILAAEMVLQFKGASSDVRKEDKLTLLISLNKRKNHTRITQVFKHKRLSSSETQTITVDILSQVLRWLHNPKKNKGLTLKLLNPFGQPEELHHYMELPAACPNADSRAKSGSMHRREKVNLTTPVYEEQTTPTISLNVTIANDK